MISIFDNFLKNRMNKTLKLIQTLRKNNIIITNNTLKIKYMVTCYHILFNVYVNGYRRLCLLIFSFISFLYMLFILNFFSDCISENVLVEEELGILVFVFVSCIHLLR